jgi:hypothetical protein
MCSKSRVALRTSFSYDHSFLVRGIIDVCVLAAR